MTARITFSDVAKRIRAERGTPLGSVDDVDLYLGADDHGDVILIRQGNAIVTLGPEAVSPLVDVLWLAEMASYCDATDPPAEQKQAPEPNPSQKSVVDRGPISSPLNDEWLKPVAAFLAGVSRATIADVAEGALSIEEPGTADQRRIAGVMEALGWRRGQRDKFARWWVRGDAHAGDAPAGDAHVAGDAPTGDAHAPTGDALARNVACRVASPVKRSS